MGSCKVFFWSPLYTVGVFFLKGELGDVSKYTYGSLILGP